ncbi:MAG TPA: cysteine--tRNA ligase [Candidatus Pacearchaeota archaeon]|nr:cysteine--tRNA ligase [archaeon BMS3Abin17]HDK41799.1 cysteine--tRNA ligase [Candidatus Pacearchaeota archaeon]HDZ60671.1 cysteine--tRNA ligase [Candidatus Pacearchaeota archaeon]
MNLKLYNTLTRKKEIFKPINKNNVGMYVCGPTIYNYVHIGNLRAYTFADILKRYLKFKNYRVKEVMNLTDVDDKTIRDSQKQGKSLKEFTKEYEKGFLEDIKNMNIEMPEVMPTATEHIKEMVEIVKNLLKKKIAYKTNDGIYFSIKKFKKYGKLSKTKIKKLKAGASERMLKDEYDKDNVNDFALWKFYTKEDGDVFWDTEIGKGRPGWHIECSAMSMKYLGQSFDIHTGGTDLIFPHHENEIAQSEAHTGKKFVKYWLHNEWILVDGRKMSKSLGNFYNLRDIIEKDYSAMELRYFYLTKIYNQKLNFTWMGLKASKISYQRLKNIISTIKDDKKINKKYISEFEDAMEDNLNTPKALQVLWRLVRDEKAIGKLRTIKKIDEVFGLKLLETEEIKIPTDILEIVKEREVARAKKNWKKADALREVLKKEGYAVDDTDKGSVVGKL